MNTELKHKKVISALVFAAAVFFGGQSVWADGSGTTLYAQSFANNSGAFQRATNYNWKVYSTATASDISGTSSRIHYYAGSVAMANVAAAEPLGSEITQGYYLSNSKDVSLSYVPLSIDTSVYSNLVIGFDFGAAKAAAIVRFAFQAGTNWYVSEGAYNHHYTNTSANFRTARIGLFGDAKFRKLAFVPKTSLQLSPDAPVTFSSITGNISNVGFYMNPNSDETYYIKVDNFTVESAVSANFTTQVEPMDIDEDNYIPAGFIPRSRFEEQFAIFAEKLRGTGAARVAPNMTVLSTENMDGYIRQLVEYNVEANERITGWLLIPAGLAVGEKRPLIMSIHGTSAYGKDSPVNNYTNYPAPDATELEKRNQRKFGEDLVQRGFICFAPDRPGYGARVLPGTTGGTIEKANAWSAEFRTRYPDWSYEYGKVTHDLQQALDFLVELDCVDADKIGAMGHSLGGHDILNLAAFDDRIKAIAHSCGGSFVYIPKLWTDLPTLENAVEKMNLGLSSRRNLLHQKIAPRGVLLLAGINDSSSPVGLFPAMETITEYYKERLPTYGLTRQHPFTVLTHTAGHAMPDYIRFYAYRWLEKQLME